MQLYGPEFDGMAQLDDNITDALKEILDMVKSIDRRLDQVKEDSQALKDELARVTNNVEELKTEVRDLKMTVDNNSEKESNQGSSAKPGVLPAVRKLVEKYSKNTNWHALVEGLDGLLDQYSAEYYQLQSITDYSWGHLWQVGSKGHQELATLLLDAGLPVDKRDNEGDTMIHGAAEGGQLELIKYLLRRGADINVRGWRGLTPFNKAALGGKPQVARWMAEHGADIHAADEHGMTSLHFAAEHGHLEVVWLLVHSGLDTSIRDRNGFTPLDWARNGGHTSVMGYLLNHPH